LQKAKRAGAGDHRLSTFPATRPRYRRGDAARQMEGSSSFLKKRTKKLFCSASRGAKKARLKNK
jgi:hypothetical protein